ncbi:MAG: hypothetical protein ACRDG7_15255 [Candidatus Limnocylindria bacterium]
MAKLGPRGPVATSGASPDWGTVRLFEDAGFEIVARRRANRISPERPIM